MISAMSKRLTINDSWPTERVRQIGILRQLIIECSSINNASNVIGRLHKIIDLANQLDSMSETDDMRSFSEFLNTLAFKEE